MMGKKLSRGMGMMLNYVDVERAGRHRFKASTFFTTIADRIYGLAAGKPLRKGRVFYVCSDTQYRCIPDDRTEI